MRFYISGVGNALSFSNIALEQRGDKPFFCPPEKIALNVENYMDIIDKEIARKQKNPNNVPVEVILYSGLVEVFPCSNHK